MSVRLFCIVWIISTRSRADDEMMSFTPLLQFRCTAGGLVEVTNPDPERFTYSFVSSENSSQLLETRWTDSHRVLMIRLPHNVTRILVVFSTRSDVVSGNGGIIYRLTCHDLIEKKIQASGGIKTIQSVIRLGSVNGNPVKEGFIQGEDLFWTIKTFENYKMKPLNCTISAGEIPFYSESYTVILHGCSTDPWLMDDFSSIPGNGSNTTTYFSRIHTFRFFRHPYLTMLCKLRVCWSELTQLCQIGWGCGYRTLQSLCSWTRQALLTSSTPDVPSIPQIQEALVAMGDKEDSFFGSRNWIGSVEVGLCLDFFYNVPCKIVHIRSGAELSTHLEDIAKHFVELGSPVMMGGDSDSSSKGIVGVCTDRPSLLVVDPHFYSKGCQEVARQDLQSQGWITWRNIENFDQQSFYNLCLPQLKGR